MCETESLARYLKLLESDVCSKSYEYWAKQELPIAYESRFEDRDTQVEIGVLEMEPEYLHLLITASNSPLGWWVTESIDVIIEKNT